MTNKEKGDALCTLEGGVVFNYYAGTNCGLINYIVIPPANKTTDLDTVLMDKAVEILDENASAKGNLAGCDAIFLEIKAAEKTLDEEEKGDLRELHTSLHRMGYRLLDFEYTQLPYTPDAMPSEKFLLTVLLTPRIPVLEFAPAHHYYLPSLTLKSFLEAIWNNCYVTGGIRHPPDEDHGYLSMIDQTELREKIPLLDLPWGEKPFTFIDLFDDYDEFLLRRFHEELMVPNFPLADGMQANSSQ